MMRRWRAVLFKSRRLAGRNFRQNRSDVPMLRRRPDQTTRSTSVSPAETRTGRKRRVFTNINCAANLEHTAWRGRDGHHQPTVDGEKEKRCIPSRGAVGVVISVAADKGLGLLSERAVLRAMPRLSRPSNLHRKAMEGGFGIGA